jgi:Flp pilus assembly protein TadD
MAIRGSLREASLPDVLQLLAMGQKTGCLSVTHRHAFGNVFFEKGRICFASIINRRDRLGDILVKHGRLTHEELEDAIAAQGDQPQVRLGEILLARNLIEREELHGYIKHQIEEAVYYLFTWTQGTFTFDPDVRPEHQDFIVSINPESLLLEGARRIDEWSMIEKKIPSLDLIFAIDTFKIAEGAPALTQEQEMLVPLIDGQRDVVALIDESGLGEFEVGKALFGLATAGFLHRVGRSHSAEQVPNDTKIAEHRNLGVAFYRTAMFDEAMREFRRVTELRPGESTAEFYLGLIALRLRRFDEAVRAFRLIASRPGADYGAHVNLAYGLERLGRLEEARAALRDAERLAPDEPAVRFALGVLALKRGDVPGANDLFRDASTHWGSRARPAAFFHYAGLTAALGGDCDRAIAILVEGTAAHPHAAVLHSNLAAIYERRARLVDAAAAVERGIVEDPTLPQLQKNAGDLAYRGGRYDEALDGFQRAIRHDPDLGGDVYLKMGNIRYRRRERDEAMRCWERSLALAPDNPMAQNNLETARRLV